MLAPIRDHLRPQDPKSSSFLCTVKDHYFTRLSVNVDPDEPGFEEAQWITSEDVNVEHLLDVFTSIDGDSADLWKACIGFMDHLRWHKGRQTVLRQKIEGLPDDHHAKLECLIRLSLLFDSLGNQVESKRLLLYTLRLERERGDDGSVAQALRALAEGNRLLGLHEEGIRQAREASEIYERLGNTFGQALSLRTLAQLLLDNGQFNEAEEAASRAIALTPEKGRGFNLCQCHRVLGEIYRYKGEKQKSIDNLETALRMATPSNWHGELLWIHYSLAELFANENNFDDANTHVKQAKSHAMEGLYGLARVTQSQAIIWYRQHNLEGAKSELLRAQEIYEELGLSNSNGAERCKELLVMIKSTME